MKIFLTGHGGHIPNNGFFALPKNSTVTFYTMYAKLMLETDVYELVSGRHTGTPHQRIAPFMNCPNMTLYKDDPPFVPKTMNALKQNPDKANCRVFCTNFIGVDQMNLKPIVEALSRKMPNEPLEFVWACCRDLSLKHVAGSTITRDAGLNAAERLSDNKFLNFDKDTWGFSGNWY